MKKKSSWIITLTLICSLNFSCNTDEEVIINPDTTVLDSYKKQCQKIAQNNTNPYDTIGKIQNYILDIYLSANHSHSTIEEINEEIQTIVNTYGNSFIGSSVQQSLTVGNQIINPFNTTESSLSTIIANSQLTNQAKVSLSGFITSLFLLVEEEYKDIHDFVVSYELSVINNSEFNDEDKRIILTTSSLSRYSFYYEKKRKDKDWETSVGNIMAGLSGALENSLTAVNSALVTGIYHNTIVTD